MPIIKNRHKDRPFVILDRTCIQDDRLSWRARGLLHYLLSLPCDWVISVNDLANRAPDGKDAVYSTMKELREVGYIRYERERHVDGTLAGSAYYVFEVPEYKQDNLADGDNVTEHDEEETFVTSPDVIFPGGQEPNQVKPDTYIINNIQNKQSKKETAAAVLFNRNVFSKTGTNNHKNIKIDGYQSSNNQLQFTSDDALIKNKLTAYQEMRVNDLATHLIGYVPYLNEQELINQITQSLLSQKHFPRCGHDFHRKLLAIQKTILGGGWTPPIESAERDLQEKQQKLHHHKKNLSAAIDALTHWQRMLDFALMNHKQTEAAYFESQIQKSKERIRQIQHDFQQQEEKAMT